MNSSTLTFLTGGHVTPVLGAELFARGASELATALGISPLLSSLVSPNEINILCKAKRGSVLL